MSAQPGVGCECVHLNHGSMYSVVQKQQNMLLIRLLVSGSVLRGFAFRLVEYHRLIQLD